MNDPAHPRRDEMKMKAIVIEQYGGPEALSLQEVSVKQPQTGEVLVRISAVGVNFVDIYWRTGFDPQPLPLIPGLEAAGVVEAICEGVNTVSPGDRVAFARQPGTYAEACVVPADSLIPLPAELSFEQGAAFPLQGMTAHYLIYDFRKPSPGDVVLIHAAAGGVGLFLVQWARHLGAHVIGTVPTEDKAEAARQAGAHDVILYTEKNFAGETMRMTNGHGAGLIIDGVGKSTFAGNMEAAALKGHIVIFGAASGPAEPISPNALMARSLSLSGGDLRHFVQSREEMLRRATDTMDGIRDGWLKPSISRVLPLSEAAEAHCLLENRQTSGKIVLSTRS